MLTDEEVVSDVVIVVVVVDVVEVEVVDEIDVLRSTLEMAGARTSARTSSPSFG